MIKYHGVDQSRKTVAWVSWGLGNLLVLTSFLGYVSIVPLMGQSSGGTLKIDVELATVHVVALDKKGRPVVNLGKENFRLFEDGKEQRILTFDVVNNKNTSASEERFEESRYQGKIVLLLFDNSTIRSRNLKRARDMAELYVQKHMRRGDWFGVAIYGNGLKIVQNLTRQGDKVLEAIRRPTVSFANSLGSKISQTVERPGPIPGFGQSAPQRLGQSPGLSRNPPDQSRRQTRRDRYQAAQAMRALKDMASALSRVKGRKSILLFAEEFSIPIDVRKEMKRTVLAAQIANVSFYTIDVNGLDASFEVGELDNLIDESVHTQRTRWESGLLGILNSRFLPRIGEITASQFSPSFVSSLQQQDSGRQGGPGSQGQGGRQRDGQGVPGNQSWGSRGNQHDPFGNRRRNDRDNFFRDEERLMRDVMRSLANATGGVSIFKTNNIEAGLDKVELELANYYVIGFQSTNSKTDGKLHKLKVKVSVKGVKLKYADVYRDIRSLNVLAGSKSERSLMKALASRPSKSQLPLVFQPFYFYQSADLAYISLSGQIGFGTLKVKKKGSYLNILGVAYSEDGSVASKFSDRLDLAGGERQNQQLRNKGLSFRNHLRLPPGKYNLRLAVATKKGKRVGTAQQDLIIPVMPDSSLACSSLVVSQQVQKLPGLIMDLQAKLLKETDPFIHKGWQVTPLMENLLDRDRPLAVFYRIYNLTQKEKERNLTAKIQWTDEHGESRVFTKNLDKIAQPTKERQVAVALYFPIDQFTPGKYGLSVETTDLATGQSVTRATEVSMQ